MRLLFVIDSFGSGGAQRQLVQLALGMVQAGHDVEFFVYAPRYAHFRPVVAAAGISIHEVDKRSRFSPRVLVRLAGLLRRGAYDGVLAYLTTPAVYTETAARLGALGRRRPAVVVSERGPLERVSLGLRLALGAHRLADHVVVNSHNNREQMLELWPSLRVRSSVIYNGIDLALFSPAAEAPPPAPGRLRLIAVGTLLPSKDALTLVEALALHRARFGWTPEVSWVGKLADGGGDPAYERVVRACLAERGLEDAWRWLGERRDVAALLRTHDALVHPSLLEGLPNAVCEALACGLPVIASRIGDNGVLVADGVTGFLHPPGDAAALCARLAEFSSLPAHRRDAMRREARAFAERTLGLARCVEDYEGLFRRLRASGARGDGGR